MKVSSWALNVKKSSPFIDIGGSLLSMNTILAIKTLFIKFKS